MVSLYSAPVSLCCVNLFVLQITCLSVLIYHSYGVTWFLYIRIECYWHLSQSVSDLAVGMMLLGSQVRGVIGKW